MFNKMKIIFAVFFVFFLLASVSAFEFDNVKSYNQTSRTITIKDSILGIPTTTVATVKLISPDNVMVMAGEERLVQEFVINLSETSYTDVFKDFAIYKVTNGRKVTRNFKIKSYEYDDTIEVPVYYMNCSTENLFYGGKGEVCSRVQNGTVEQDVYDWKPVAKLDMTKGMKRIGVFVEVEPGDYMDGIPKLFGVDISEWATWQESFNTGLDLYWKLNESAVTVENFANASQYNGTKINGVTSGFGKIGNASVFVSGSSQLINGSYYFPAGTTQKSISFWLNFTSGAQQWAFGGGEVSAGKAVGMITNYAGAGDLYVWGQGSDFGCSGYGQNVFHHVAIIYSGGNLRQLWIDGTNCANNTGAYNTGTVDEFSIGAYSGGAYLDGMIDEVGIWNRSLNNTEILDLYNGGAGITYTNDFGGTVTTTLLTPDTAYNTTNSNVSFSVNSSVSGASLDNVTIYVWNATDDALVWNETQTITGTTSNVTNWSRVFADGDYIWNALTFADSGASEAWATNRTFKVDTINPLVEFISPANDTTFITNYFPYGVPFNFSAQDANLQACWFHTNDNLTNGTFTCGTFTNATFSSEGNKIIYGYANDTLGSFSGAQVNLTILFYNYTTFESADPIAEGAQATFNLTVNMTNLPSTSAVFKYNNTAYTPTTQTTTQNSTTFGVSFVIPAGYGNATGITQYWNWSFNITGIVNTTTATETQTVLSPGLSDCASGGVLILNFTHYDEETKEIVNYSAGNNLQVDLSLSSLADNSVQFIYNGSATDAPSLLVCVGYGVLNSTSYRIDLTGSYVGTDFAQEFFYIDNGTIENDTSPQEYAWYDLLLTDSTTFLFTFLDENGLQVPGVIINTLRYYIGAGQFLEVERSKEDNNGETHIHLVEEDVIYKFNVTLNNQQIFLSDQYNAKCLSSPLCHSPSAD